MSANFSIGQLRISGDVLKIQCKTELAQESRGKVCLVEKFVFSFEFQALAPRGLMFAPTTKYERISGAFALDNSNFFRVVVFVTLVRSCGSFAEKCGKANKSSRKCAGRNYFLYEDLTD